MTVINPPFALQTASIEHSAKLFRRAIAGIIKEGVTSFNTAGDLKVIESSPAAMSVRVERGGGFVQGDDTTDQGLYFVYNDGYTTVAVPAADGTNPRKDLIVFSVNDNTEGQAGDTSLLELIQGTPAGSPAEPALPSTALKLAVITVPAAASTITSANVADSRVGAGSDVSGSDSDVVLTDQPTTSGSFANLTTVGPTVTVIVGPSGKVLISLHADMNNNSASAYSLMGFAISGATTQAASDDFALAHRSEGAVNIGAQFGTTFLLEGLTPGSTTFQAKYRTTASTANFKRRRLAVVPL